MSSYCIGDLHGRYDLLLMLLDKIKFNPSIDHIYFLGDVINGHTKEANGSIKILQFMMNHTDSCTLVRGNHENFLLFSIPFYKLFFTNEKFKITLLTLANSPTVLNQLLDLNYGWKLDHLLASGEVYEWVRASNGNYEKRKAVHTALKAALTIKELDIEKFLIFCQAIGKSYKCKEFIKELETISEEEFDNIISYIESSKDEISLKIGKKKFCLIHDIGKIDNRSSYHRVCVQSNTKNTYYIYGHQPVPKFHKKIHELTAFNFDCRKIFSFVDANQNIYYNLDLGSNPIAALCLENLNEIYAGKPSSKSEWKTPPDVTEYQPYHIELYEHPLRIVDEDFKKNETNKFIFLTFQGHSYEYLIAVNRDINRISYTRISWLDITKPIIEFEVKKSQKMNLKKIVKAVEHNKTSIYE